MAKSKKDSSKLIHIIIGMLLIFVVGRFIPTFGSVTRLGVEAICIFLGLIWMAINGVSFIISAILALFGAQFTGYMSASAIISATCGNSLIYQLILVYVLCQGLIDCGAGDVMARFIITRKWAQGRPLIFTFMLIIAGIFAGAFLGLGGIVFYYTIIEAIRTELGYDKDSDWLKFNVFGVYIGACIGMTLLPYKGIPLIVFSSLNEMIAEANLAVVFPTFMLGILLFGIIAAIVYCLMMKYVFKVDMSKLSDFDITKMDGMSSLHMTKQQKIITIVFGISLLYGVLTAVIPSSTSFGAALSSITQVIFFALCVAVLCIIHVDGKPVLDSKTAFGKGVAWEMLFSLAAFTFIGGMLTSADAGIQTWLSTTFDGLFGGLSFPVFTLIIYFITLVLTNVLSNTAIGLIMTTLSVPFLVGYAQTSGINVTLFATGFMMIDMYAFLTPAACGSAPIFFSQECIAGDKKFVWTKGLAVCGVHFLIIWAMFTFGAYIF